MEEILGHFIQGNDFMVKVLAFIGLLRLIIKPIMELIKAYTAFTKNEKDDSLVEHIIKSPIYTKVIFVIDWLTSIKINKK